MNIKEIKNIKQEIINSYDNQVPDHLRVLVLSLSPSIRDDPKMSIKEFSNIYKSYKSGTKLITSDKQFNIENEIGEGGFGSVYLVKNKLTKLLYAMKIILLTPLNDFKLRFVRNEIKIYPILSHPNIAKYYGHFINNKKIYILLEYVKEGDIYDIIQRLKEKRLKEKRAAKYTYQVLKAIKYLHNLNIAHRDIKPENILIDKDDNIKLIDFGYAIKIKKNDYDCDVVGTSDYISPEMVAGKKHNLSTDIWSIGVLMYELVIGHSPFFSKSRQESYRNIVEGKYSFPKNIKISINFKDLIGKILQTNPINRPTASKIMKHKWFN